VNLVGFARKLLLAAIAVTAVLALAPASALATRVAVSGSKLLIRGEEDGANIIVVSSPGPGTFRVTDAGPGARVAAGAGCAPTAVAGVPAADCTASLKAIDADLREPTDDQNGFTIDPSIPPSVGSVVEGGAGRDFMNLRGGDDVVRGHNGFDTIHGGGGSDAIDGGPEANPTSDPELHDDLSGDAGNDKLVGGRGGDTLDGGDGDDILDGGEGDDFMRGGAGADTFAGGAGRDTASYADHSVSVIVSVGKGSYDDGALILGGVGGFAAASEGDTVGGSVEVVEGTDLLDVLDGGPGNDTLAGRGGNDLLRGNSGKDALIGEGGRDDLSGGDGNDSLLARDGGRDSPMKCGRGRRDKVESDARDRPSPDCERIEEAPVGQGPNVQVSVPLRVTPTGLVRVRLRCPLTWRPGCKGRLTLERLVTRPKGRRWASKRYRRIRRGRRGRVGLQLSDQELGLLRARHRIKARMVARERARNGKRKRSILRFTLRAPAP
jgi:hypothetical protein